MRRDVREKGFTLVELAIVMVIIGLLIGAVLKGQAMIDDAKGKRLLNDMQGISAAMFAYLDRYSAYPGDDSTNHGWAGVTVGNGNGTLNGDPNNTSDGQETHEAWQAMRYAGLLSGDPASTGAAHLPKNPFGGQYRIENRNFGIGTRLSITATGVAGSIAELYDIKHDDGVYNTGTVQANQAFTNATVDLYYSL